MRPDGFHHAKSRFYPQKALKNAKNDVFWDAHLRTCFCAREKAPKNSPHPRGQKNVKKIIKMREKSCRQHLVLSCRQPVDGRLGHRLGAPEWDQFEHFQNGTKNLQKTLQKGEKLRPKIEPF
jgi:hypothetical protein